MTTEYADLLLDNGELVRIEFDDAKQDELFDALEHCMKRGDWWSPAMFDGCSATYLGLHISRVAMKRVVAIL